MYTVRFTEERERVKGGVGVQTGEVRGCIYRGGWGGGNDRQGPSRGRETVTERSCRSDDIPEWAMRRRDRGDLVTKRRIPAMVLARGGSH